jgi:hypothetical protein
MINPKANPTDSACLTGKGGQDGLMLEAQKGRHGRHALKGVVAI